MTFGLVGLLLGMAIAAPDGGMVHSARIDHRTGAVHSNYTADVQVTHQQIGTVGVGGRPSTLRCLWRAGLVVERGSLLSHSAIVARELGLPAVVSVAGATSWLADGDRVRLDGATGRVERLAAHA